MPSPVCVPCRREMRCSKNGRVLETLSAGEPYQLWSGDEFECPSCGTRVIARFGMEPIAEAHEGARYQVNREWEAQHENLVVIE